jgi:hypothetical protein
MSTPKTKRAARALQARDGCSYLYALRVVEDVVRNDAKEMQALRDSSPGMGLTEAVLKMVEFA